MTNRRGPDCCCECCTCRPSLVLEWTGDRDFTGDLDVTTYPLYQARFLTQRPETSMLWRIRYQPDEAFEQWLTDNRIVRTLISGPFVTADDVPSNAAAELSGPVRDGMIYGLDTVPVSQGWTTNGLGQIIWPTLPPDWNFDRGTRNFQYWNTNGTPGNRANWTQEDWPGNPVSLPWVLELGCARCPCVESVSWPDYENWHHDPVCWYDHWTPAGECQFLGGNGGGAIDPAQSTLISTTESQDCLDSSFDDQQSVYWPGDEVEPDHPPDCPPACIVWTPHLWDSSGSGTDSIATSRSKPGVGYGTASEPGLAYTKATQLIEGVYHAVCWSGRNERHVITSRCARGDSADIAAVDCIWLAGGQWVQRFVAADMQWIVDWLGLGGKTLIVDDATSVTAAWLDLAGVPVGTFPGNNSANANLFLGAIGSSMTFYDIQTYHPADEVTPGDPAWWSSYFISTTVKSTQAHTLAPDPETLFTPTISGDNEVSVGTQQLASLAVLGGTAAIGISGGTALYEHDATMQYPGPLPSLLPSTQGPETHPVIAVEETNGNRIIACSLKWLGPLVDDTDTGSLTVTPNINAFLGRVLTTI